MIATQAVTALALLLSPAPVHPGVVGPGVVHAVQHHGSAFVAVAFDARTPRSLAATRSIVRAVRARVLARAGRGFQPATRWDAVPGMAGWVRAEGLRRLASDPLVRRIDLDVGGHAADLQADPLVHADEARAAGWTGDAVTVGILDTGMQLGHPDLADSLVAQQCYVSAPGTCPNGLHQQSGAGAGRDENGHGTNVAGIVTGNGGIAPIGVAPSSKLVIVRVLAANGSFATTSQVISGLQWMLDRPELGVKVINMSLGTDALYSGFCDNATAFAQNFASVVRSLRSQGVTIFASSGNQRAKASMALPACLKQVVAVGAVYDSAYGSNQFFCTDPSVADKVTCFSNSSSALDLLAPGAAIASTGTGSSTSTYYGTSQASPMAAATAADVLQANPALTPAQVESTLKATGVSITDSRSGAGHRVTPRIDVLAAANAVAGGNVPPPPPPQRDTAPPTVRPLGTSVKRKEIAILYFRVFDNNGSAIADGGVYRGRKQLEHFGPKTYRNGRHGFRWRAGPKAGRARFCLKARDASGNRSKQSCAVVHVT
jgi:subtilisin family serine protease